MKLVEPFVKKMGGARLRGRSRHCAANREVAGAIVSLEFFIYLTFPAALWP
jgi:hypothetical protein